MAVVLIFSQGSGNNAQYQNIYSLAYSFPDTRDAYMMQTDALAKGQIYLDIEPSEELLALENPYDLSQRDGIDYIWDFAFYNGKYYSYFGIIPVILFLLPFRLITGMYFSSFFFSFFMEMGAIFSLAFFYRAFVQRFFKNCNAFIFTFGLIAVLFGSNILFLSSRSWFYEIAYASGLMFTFLSLTMLIKIHPDKPHCFRYTFLAALFFALSVGCRPNYCIYFIIHIPILMYLLKTTEQKNIRLKMIAFYAVPVIVTGCFIGLFNFMRFGSFFQFGAIYQLTVSDISQNNLFDFGKIQEGLLRYFLQPIGFDTKFPFVFLSKYEFTSAASDMYSNPVVGLICYPVIWNIIFLPFVIYHSIIKKKSDKNSPVISFIIGIIGMIICSVIMVVAVTASAGIMERYTTDFRWILTAAAVFTFFCFINCIDNYKSKKMLIINRIAKIWFCISVVCSSYFCFGIGTVGEFSRITFFLPFLFG